jgi:hypothetical protein
VAKRVIALWTTAIATLLAGRSRMSATQASDQGESLCSRA